MFDHLFFFAGPPPNHPPGGPNQKLPSIPQGQTRGPQDGNYYLHKKNLPIGYTLFYYKNLVYKNTNASNSPKIKNILRTYKGFKSLEKNFAYNNI